MARPKRITRQEETALVKFETYTPPSSYDLPPEVFEAFKKKGFHLRFVRVLLDNKEDYKNVADRRREGYEFVTIMELPDHIRHQFETKSFGQTANKFSDIVVVGDLALMKITLAKAAARKRYYENIALETELAQARSLSKDSKLNRLLPIVDDSETVVRTGGRNSSPSEFGKTLKSTQLEDQDDSEE